MNEWKNWLKLAVIACLYLLASHWDYEDTQRVQSGQDWARVAGK